MKNRKRENLNNFVVVNSNQAYISSIDKHGNKKFKYRKGVYGAVDTKFPFVYKIGVKDNTNQKYHKFIEDTNKLPNICKERIMNFYEDVNNKTKEKAYLIDKDIWEAQVLKDKTLLELGKKTKSKKNIKINKGKKK